MVGTTALGLSRELRTRPIGNRPRTSRRGQGRTQTRSYVFDMRRTSSTSSLTTCDFACRNAQPAPHPTPQTQATIITIHGRESSTAPACHPTRSRPAGHAPPLNGLLATHLMVSHSNTSEPIFGNQSVRIRKTGTWMEIGPLTGPKEVIPSLIHLLRFQRIGRCSLRKFTLPSRPLRPIGHSCRTWPRRRSLPLPVRSVCRQLRPLLARWTPLANS